MFVCLQKAKVAPEKGLPPSWRLLGSLLRRQEGFQGAGRLLSRPPPWPCPLCARRQSNLSWSRRLAAGWPAAPSSRRTRASGVAFGLPSGRPAGCRPVAPGFCGGSRIGSRCRHSIFRTARVAHGMGHPCAVWKTAWMVRSTRRAPPRPELNGTRLTPHPGPPKRLTQAQGETLSRLRHEKLRSPASNEALTAGPWSPPGAQASAARPSARELSRSGRRARTQQQGRQGEVRPASQQALLRLRDRAKHAVGAPWLAPWLPPQPGSRELLMEDTS